MLVKCFGIVYSAINTINGMIYIGQTTQSFHKRRLDHESSSRLSHKRKSYFHKALHKYGVDNFKWEVLEYCDSKEELDDMEFHYIKQYDSFGKKGYNLTFGGEGSLGRRQSLETRAKISKTKTGTKISDGLRLKFSMLRKGVPKSKDHIASVANSVSRYWKITFPSGEDKVVKNLSAFCRKYNLSDRGMNNVSKGRRTHHKGYRCIKLSIT